MMHAFYFAVDTVDTHGATGWQPTRKNTMYDAFDCNHYQSAALFDTVCQMLPVSPSGFFKMFAGTLYWVHADSYVRSNV
jgi:hypothetical protein